MWDFLFGKSGCDEKGICKLNIVASPVTPKTKRPELGPQNVRTKNNLLHHLYKDRHMVIMMLPGIIIFILFKYWPMFGLIAGFENYKPYLGFFHSPWVGWANFHRFFTESAFWELLRNTLILGVYHLVFNFPIPIVLALLLNELPFTGYKRVTQTLIYLPHFLSMVVVASLTTIFFATQDGIINQMMGTSINFLANPHTFRAEIILQGIWKEAGWGTIIYLAALTGVDPQLYEAAEMDGANRWQQMWHVTLPAIRGTIVILLILHMGAFLNSGFQQILLMENPLNQSVADVYDTFTYTIGITNGQLSYSTAVGMFKSVVSLILVLTTNKLAKLIGEQGLF